ncbi:LOW QUALITY PROTEIN: uncharacterized protein LOC134823679 [Bolinopsis microptera]|uniref:LOW QUALITY PROTEIN: uncharacterized protein LOC134823679 n=1 Tax=Bolinopsis microptera TaxID=2820187 RepID=UPI003078FE8B
MASIEDDIVISCIRTVVVKTCSTAATLTKFTGERLLDLVGLVFNLAAICTIVRAYPTVKLIWRYRDDKAWRFWVWRGGGLLQLAIFISDIPFAVMFILETVFFWRLALLIRKKIKKDRSWFEKYCWKDFGYIGFQIRADIFKSFLGLTTDILVIPFAITVFSSWRFKRAYDKLKSEDRDLKRKLILLQQFLLLLLDIAVLIMFLIQCLTWRLPVMILHCKKIGEEYSATSDATTIDEFDKIDWDFRRRTFHNFLRLILDILMLPLVLLLFFSWRAPILIKKFKKFAEKLSDKSSSMSRWDAESQLRGGILTHFWRYCIDLATLVPILVVLCSWRFPILILKFQRFFKTKMKRQDELKLRYSIFFHAGQVLIDLLSIPPMLITIFSWRLVVFVQIFPLDSNKTVARKFKKVRLQFWWEFLYFLLDLPVIVAFCGTTCLSWCFPWRLLKIFKEFKEFGATWKWKTTVPEGHANDNSSLVWFYSLRSFYRHILCNNSRNRMETSFPHTVNMRILIRKVMMMMMMTMQKMMKVKAWKPNILVKHLMVPQERSSHEGSDAIKSQEVTQETIELGQVTESTAIGMTEADSAAKPEDSSNIVDKKDEDPVPSNPSFSDKFFGVRGWKIRKAICLNIFGLLLDIPSFIMLIINCAFMYQIPFLLQRFLECGDFYQEFFFIMVDETNHLLQDIAFFLLFLVLTIVRPISVWINIFEDNDHLKAKKSKEYLKKLRHIIKQRKNMQLRIDSALSVFVKYNQLYAASPDSVTKRFIDEVMVYNDEIKDSRDKMLDRELDDKLIYILANIYFYESKKPYLFTRRFKLEEMYCLRPCVAARESNLKMWTEEIKLVNDKLEIFYEQIVSFKIKTPPLWGDKNGFFLRTRKQNQKVIIHTITSGYFGTVALFVLNSIFIYRIPIMIRNMLKVSYCRFRVRDACLEQTKQYLLDWLAMFKVLIVVLSLYRCLALLSDLAHDILSKRSLSAARKTADKYPVNILKDLFKLLKLFFKWDTVVFLFASILFIILIPLSVIINTIRAANVIQSIGIVFILSLPYLRCNHGWTVCYRPQSSDIVLSNEGISNNHIAIYIAGYLGIVSLILAAFVMAKTKEKDAVSRKVKSIDYIRFNWFNAQVVFLEVLELVQLLALVFSIRNLIMPYAEDIRTVAQYILLDIYSYKLRFGFSVALFIIWLVVCTVPTLLEGVTKKFSKGHFSERHFVWRSFLSFFGITLFVSLPEMNISLLACDYTECSNSIVCPSLFDDPDIACWSGIHLIIAPISFFMMVWYLLTSLLYCLQYTDVGNKKVDLQFSPPFSALVNLFKLALIIGVGLFSEEKVAVLGFVVALMVLLIIASLLFPLVTGMEVCNTKALLIWRIETFVVVVLVALGILAFEVIEMTESFKSWSDGKFIFNETTKFIDFVIPLTVLILIVISVIISLILTKIFKTTSKEEKARSQFKDIIKKIVKPKISEHEPDFIPHWRKVHKPFMRMLQAVRVADKNDKDFTSPEAEYVQVDGVPPPSYDPDMMYLPPPPSYDNVVDSPEHAVNSVSGLEVEIGIPKPGDDEFFLPTPAMYLNPIGSYEKYDATCLLDSITTRDPNPGGIFKAGWVLNETVPGGKEKQLTDSHCTGIDLLLLLEEHIYYTACSYDFIVCLQGWRDEVKESNWIGLRDCALKLRDNLTASYHKPRDIVKAEEYDILPPHVDHSHIPEYVALSDITALKLDLHRRGVEKLMSILPEPWVTVFRRIIPSSDSDTPLIYKVSSGREDSSNMWDIKVEMFQEVEIVIKGIEGEGFKAAVGASIVLTNPIVISRIRKWNKRINFGKPYPYGKKGMLSHSITSCGCKRKNGEFSLVAAGKSVKLHKVLSSLADLEWRFRD